MITFQIVAIRDYEAISLVKEQLTNELGTVDGIVDKLVSTLDLFRAHVSDDVELYVTICTNDSGDDLSGAIRLSTCEQLKTFGKLITTAAELGVSENHGQLTKETEPELAGTAL